MKNHLNILTRFTCAGLLSWVVATSSADGETPASPGLRLNEILASNRAGRLDDEGESSESSESAASYNYQLYDSRRRSIELYEPHEVLDTIDLRFEDDAGALFDPVSATVHISVL